MTTEDYIEQRFVAEFLGLDELKNACEASSDAALKGVANYSSLYI